MGRYDDVSEDVLKLLSDAGDKESSDTVNEDVTYVLSLLADAGLTVLHDYEEPAMSEVHRSEELSMIMLHKFSILDISHLKPLKWTYEKAVEILQKPNATVCALVVVQDWKWGKESIGARRSGIAFGLMQLQQSKQIVSC